MTTIDEQQAQQFEQANPPDLPPEPPPPEPVPEIVTPEVPPEPPPPEATQPETIPIPEEAPPMSAIPGETLEDYLSRLPENVPPPPPAPLPLSPVEPLKPDVSGINLPADYEFTSEPYDVIVKMALEGATDSELLKYLSEHPDADRGAYAGRLLEPIMQQVRDAESLNGTEQFDKYRQLGLIPADAEYIDIGGGKWGYTVPSAQSQYQMPADFKVSRSEMAYIRANLPDVYKAIQADLGTAFASYGDKIVLSQWEAKFQKSDPQMFEVYKNAGGGQAGTEAVNSLIAKTNAEFESNLQQTNPDLYQIYKTQGYTAYYNAFKSQNTPVGKSGEWVNNATLASMRSSNPILAGILVSGGFDAYNKALSDAQSSLEPYKQSVPYSASAGGYEVDEEGHIIAKATPAVTYDLVSFLLKNPDGADTLLVFGFTQESVDATQKVVDTITASLVEIKSVLGGKKSLSGQISALTDAVSNAGFYNPTLLGQLQTIGIGGGTQWVKDGKVLADKDIAKLQWNALTDDQKAEVARLYSEDLYKTNYFAEYTKQMGEVAEKGGLAGSLIYSPVLGITIPVAKATTGQKVSGQEIVVAGLTAVGDVLMLGGGEALVSLGKTGLWTFRGITTAMGTTQAVLLKQNAAQMSKGELALGVVTDALLFLPMIGAIGKGLIKTFTTPSEATAQRIQLENALRINKDILAERFVSEASTPAELRTPNLYSDLTKATSDYADARIRLVQAQKVISEIGFPKNPSEVELLKQAYVTINGLTGKTPVLDIPNAEISTEIRLLPKGQVGELTTLRDNLLATLKKYNASIKGSIGVDDPLLLREMQNVENQAINRIDATVDAIVTAEPELPRVQEAIRVIGEGKELATADVERVNAQLDDTIAQLGDEQTTLMKLDYLRDVSRGDYIQSKLIEANDNLAQLSRLDLPDVSAQQRVEAQIKILKENINFWEQAKALREQQTFAAIQHTTEPIYGKESYGAVLDELNDRLDFLTDFVKSNGGSPDGMVRASLVIFDAMSRGNTRALTGAISLLQLEAGKLPTKALQIQAGEQVKMIKGLTVDDLMKRWSTRDVSATKGGKMFKGGAGDETTTFASVRANAIKLKAERIVSDRWDKITRRLPDRILSRSREDILQYMKDLYGEESFEVDGVTYDNIDEYLDVGRVEDELRAEIVEQERIDAIKRDLAIRETEKNLADKFKNKVTDPKLRKVIEDRSDTMMRQIKEKKRELTVAEKQKTQTPPMKTYTPEEAEKMKPAVRKDNVPAKEPAKTEGAPAKGTKSTFPGISSPRVTVVTRQGVRTTRTAERIGSMTPEQAQRLYGDEFQIIDTRLSPMRIPYTVQGVKEWLSPSDAIREAIRIQTSAAQKEAVRQGVQTYARTQSKIALQNAVQTYLQQAIKTATSTALKTALQQAIQPAIQEAIKVTITTGIITPPPPPPPPPPPTTDGIIRVPPPEGGIGVGVGRQIPDGSLTWKRGIFWKYLAAPWDEDKPHTLRYPPIGALNTSGRTAQETLQVIGRPPVRIPKEFSVDEGTVDYFITDYGKTITFAGHGTLTDVGARLSSPTTGLSIEEGGDYIKSDFAGVPATTGINRTKMSKARPKRSSKRLTEYERMTTLKGFRIR